MNANKRRDKIEIARDILEVCKNPNRLTYILRLANLHYDHANIILPNLVSGGYLNNHTVQPKGIKRSYRTWQTTKKGRELIKEIDVIMSKVGGYS